MKNEKGEEPADGNILKAQVTGETIKDGTGNLAIKIFRWAWAFFTKSRKDD